MMKCSRHPRYLGLRDPRVDCWSCWVVRWDALLNEAKVIRGKYFRVQVQLRKAADKATGLAFED